MLDRSRSLYIDITDYLVYFSHSSSVSGIQRVELNLINHLEDSIDVLSAFANIRFCLTHPESGGFAQVPTEQARRLQLAINCHSSIAKRSLLCHQIFRSCEYAKDVDFQDGDLLLFLGPPFATPNQLDAYTKSRSRSRFVCIAVCHDLLPLEYPEFFPASLPSAFAVAHSKLNKLADGFICNSNYTMLSVRAHDIASQVLRSESMYDYWRLGDHANISPSSVPDFADSDRFGDEYTMLKSKQYVLIVSTLEPRKNHDTVLRAWRLLLNKADKDKLPIPALVFAGKKGWKYDSLLSEIKSLQHSGISIYHLDGVSDASLRWLYANCLFTVMPSYAEGLGLSIIESHGHGKTCIASNTTAMPEAASPYSPTFDPYSARDLFHKICDLLYEDKLLYWRQQLESREHFTWLGSSQQFYHKLERMYMACLREKACRE